MKVAFTLISVILVFSISAKEKVYTEVEFKDKLMKEVEKRLIRLGRKKIVGFSKELLQKEENIRLSSLELEKERQQLKINQGTFEGKIKSLQTTQGKFLSCLDQMDKQKDKRIGHMVDVIAGMKADKAASILSVQETEISIQILGLLDATKVSKIFNLMDKEISARLQKQYMTMKR